MSWISIGFGMVINSRFTLTIIKAFFILYCKNRIIQRRADSLDKAFPFPESKCKKLDCKRSLVYFLGIQDSTSKEIVGFSNFHLD